MGDKFSNKEVDLSNKKFPLVNLLIYFFISFIVILGIIVLILLNNPTKLIETCGDSTFYETCSLSKPYFCEDGFLISDSVKCGCPSNLDKMESSCDSEYFIDPREIILNYTFNGEDNFLVFTYYGGVVDYLTSLSRSIYYGEGELPKRADFKLMKIENELQKDLLMPLVVSIQNLAPYSKDDQARIAVSLVQNIPYLEPESVSVFGGKFNLRVSRYPYQTIYDSAGSCEGKSELLTFLLKEIGYGVSLFYYPVENHEAVGIACPVENSFKDTKYCFIETTMPSPISYSEGRYLGPLGSNKLASNPEIILINEGISLGENLGEYKDAAALTKIINQIDRKGKINYFQKNKFDKLREKYSLLY